MIGYAVKQNGSWRCVDTDRMQLEDDEVFQEIQPEAVPSNEGQ